MTIDKNFEINPYFHSKFIKLATITIFDYLSMFGKFCGQIRFQRLIVYCAAREKKFILRVWSLMPEKSEGNNHTSKIYVFPVLDTIFFLLWGQKIDLFAPRGEIKSTLWPASRKTFIRFTFFSITNHLRPVKSFILSRKLIVYPDYG